jgi:hypothetical protein
MADSFLTNDSNAYVVDISAIGGLQIFAINQRWEVMELVLLIDDRVDSEVLL